MATKGAVDDRGQASAKCGRGPRNRGSILVRGSEVVTVDVVGCVFLLLAFKFNYPPMVGSGFALLAGCFVWFWLAQAAKPVSKEPRYGANRGPRILARKRCEGRSILGEKHIAGAVLANRQEGNDSGGDL